MRAFFLFSLVSLTMASLSLESKAPPPIPLTKRISPADKRYSTFSYALRLMLERRVKTIVETGTSRGGKSNCSGDGCSTLIWSNWAIHHGAKVYSVDLDPQAIANASFCCRAYQECTTFITSDSVAFLQNFGQPIDFLYLDSFDLDNNNPDPSQQHHLKEIEAAYPYLHEKSIVMIDDCGFPNGGKGKLVIAYLLEKGWKIALSNYQVILLATP